jgi:N-formylglutamate amidohydrolase
MASPPPGPDGDSPEFGASASDSTLALLLAQPFEISRPQVQTLPFVFASGHSGRHYPDRLIAESRLDPLTLRRSEDAFVDELFAGVAGLGAPLIAASFPRAYCDVNRAASEIDAAMFDAALEIPVDAPTPRVTAGLGVIPRIVRDGAEIYARKLAPHEARLRLSRLYKPYHAALAALAEETRKRFGVAVVVDCHSMPSALSVPDIVLGDRYGASAPALLTGWAENAFVGGRFSTARNAPYAGGYTTMLYGRGSAGLFGLQIEINRGLYLDEDRIRRKPSFDAMKKRLTDALARLTAIDPSLLGGHSLPLAAE